MIFSGDNGERKIFNYHLSKGRVYVEHAIGLLKSSSPHLGRARFYDMARLINAVEACIKIHNF